MSAVGTLPGRAPGGAQPIHLVGNVNLDIVLGPVEPWPRVGTERIVAEQEVRVGGAAGVAAMALDGLGVPCRLHASVAGDAFGALLREGLGRAGRWLQTVPGSTAFSVCIGHPNGERTFLTALGHLSELDLDAVAGEVGSGPAGLVLVCGYFLLPPLRGRSGLRLLQRARSAGHTLLFDPGWPSEGFTGEVRSELEALLPLVDVTLPNELEALQWTGAGTLLEALARLERLGPRVVIKRGSSGASWREGTALRTATPPAAPVADSVGAGDCFNAGLLAALREGTDVAAAVARAVRYASRVIARRPRDYRP